MVERLINLVLSMLRDRLGCQGLTLEGDGGLNIA